MELLKLLNNLRYLSEIPVLSEQIKSLEEQVYNKKLEDASEEYLPLDKVIQVLRISKRKMLQLRSQGKIAYIKINKNTIFITRAELTRFMSDHEVKATNRFKL